MRQLSQIVKKKKILYSRSIQFDRVDVLHRTLLGHYLKGWFLQNVEGHIERRKGKVKISNKKIQIAMYTDWYSPVNIYLLR